MGLRSLPQRSSELVWASQVWRRRLEKEPPPELLLHVWIARSLLTVLIASRRPPNWWLVGRLRWCPVR
jgi:hypothetical protein